MDKLKIVIIDDEYRIGTLISKLIHYEELNMELAGVFWQSQEALAFIADNKPDIVISDIQMPMIDGLELIRLIKMNNINPHFILISGFREFEYARTALKYGVEDYLLKPVKEDELNKILSKVGEVHQEIILQNQEREELKQIAKRERILTNKEALLSLYKERFPGTLPDFNQLYNTQFCEARFKVYAIRIDYSLQQMIDPNQNLMVIRNITSKLENELDQLCYESAYASVNESEVYGLMNYSLQDTQTITQKLKEIFIHIKEHIGTMFDVKVTMVLTEDVNFQEIHDAFVNVKYGIVQRMILGTDRIIQISEKKQSSFDFDSQTDARIHRAVSGFQEKELEKIIAEIFQKSKDENADAEAYMTMSEAIIDSFFASLGSIDHMSEEKKEVVISIQRCYSVQLLETCLKNELLNTLRETNRSFETKTRKPIREAIQYVNEHYHEKITLDEIAENAGMNTSYFSTLFKKETGENFQNYLTNVRIEKAKYLLASTNDTMAAIALQVGYIDTRYFSQSFTKIVGIKPSLYRKMHS